MLVDPEQNDTKRRKEYISVFGDQLSLMRATVIRSFLVWSITFLILFFVSKGVSWMFAACILTAVQLFYIIIYDGEKRRAYNLLVYILALSKSCELAEYKKQRQSLDKSSMADECFCAVSVGIGVNRR